VQLRISCFANAADDRYRLTVEVPASATASDDDVWVSQIAKPHIDALCRDIVWPVSIATAVRLRNGGA